MMMKTDYKESNRIGDTDEIVVERFDKIPWNTVEYQRGSLLYRGIP